MGAVESRKFSELISPEAVVVDFGCGGGEVLAAISCRQRIGVEPNAQSALASLKRGLEVVDSVNQLPTAIADVVISNHALEHCTRPLDELKGIRRVLKPGGRLILVVPVNDWRREKRYRSADINHHLYTWTPLLLGNLLTEAGFSVERIRILTHAWPPGARLFAQAMPRWLFDGVCSVWSVLMRQRQIHAVAQA
jgi:SAM-dependent methyltransferase